MYSGQASLLYYLNLEFPGSGVYSLRRVFSVTTNTMAYVSVEADDVRAPSFLCQYNLIGRVDVASRGRAGKARIQMCVNSFYLTNVI